MDYKCADTFDFTLPTKIVYGPGRVKEVVNELKALGGNRPLIITDKGIRQVGIADIVTDLLDEAGIQYVIYDGVEANPKDVNAEDGARKAREIDADCMIAVGGGSPIDCAKAVGVLLGHDAEFIKPYE